MRPSSQHERRPGIIISDVNLLVGTGPHAVQTIKSTLGEIPVIFVTASPETCKPCESSSVILIKPIDPTCLMEAFRRLAPL